MANQALASCNIWDVGTYTQMMSNVKTKAAEEIIGKVFIKNKVTDLNNLLARRI
jgi:hypothetical protein